MTNKPKILLTGGTGQLGKMLLKQMDHEYHQVDILTRNKIVNTTKNVTYLHADITKPETLNLLKTDYDTIIHCASNPKDSDLIDVKGTENLLKTIKGSCVKNFIYISIVGVDKTTYNYYQNKRKTEELIMGSGLPYTILRVTQFHDFVYNRILNPSSENEIVTVPHGLTFQPIDLMDACEEILRLIENGATNTILRIGGPEILDITDIVNTYQNSIIPPKKITMVSPDNEFQGLFTTGINLCPDYKKGKITWRDFLIKKINS